MSLVRYANTYSSNGLTERVTHIVQGANLTNLKYHQQTSRGCGCSWAQDFYSTVSCGFNGLLVVTLLS